MAKFKVLVVMLTCLSCAFWSNYLLAVESPKRQDIFLFEKPFLIGKWYVENPDPHFFPQNFHSITLVLASDYSFHIQLVNKDNSVLVWAGKYNATDDVLVIGSDSENPQQYQYSVNANQLIVNGVPFAKLSPKNLTGYWRSTEVRGSDIASSSLSHIDLVLYPNFYFSIQSSNKNGNNKYRDGVYYTEDNHIFFLYNDGEQASQYSLSTNNLILTSPDEDMYIDFRRLALGK
ncbi:MAG: hypothetical protein ACK5NC_08035 [Vibrio sp.]